MWEIRTLKGEFIEQFDNEIAAINKCRLLNVAQDRLGWYVVRPIQEGKDVKENTEERS